MPNDKLYFEILKFDTYLEFGILRFGIYLVFGF